jgi:hypothetical protein
MTLCLERTVTFNLSANTTFYKISDQISDFIVPLRVTFGGLRLKADTLHNLDLRATTWRRSPGNPTRYAQHGFDLLAVYKQPAGSSSLTLTYAAEPAVMAQDFHLPEIAAEQSVHLEDFAFWYCRLKEGGTELQNAAAKLTEFLEAAQKYAAFTRARSQAQLYDNYPADLSTFEKGRFLIKLANQPQKPKGGTRAA